MSNLSPSTLALLRAAKTDAPSKESRQAIWGGVTSGLVTHTPLHITPQGVSGAPAAPPPVAPVGVPAAAAAKSVAITAGLTGMKGAFVGALLGSAISIGVATFMLRTKPMPAPQNDIPRAPLTTQVAAPANGGATAQANANVASPNAANVTSLPTTELDALPISANAGSSPISLGSSMSTASAPHTTSATTSSADDTTAHATRKKSITASADQDLSPDDTLIRESTLVAEARRDLQNDDAAAALKAARAARNLEARQFEPEEMKLEAAALRKLGRDTEAGKIESQRRSMYPNAL